MSYQFTYFSGNIIFDEYKIIWHFQNQMYYDHKDYSKLYSRETWFSDYFDSYFDLFDSYFDLFDSFYRY